MILPRKSPQKKIHYLSTSVANLIDWFTVEIAKELLLNSFFVHALICENKMVHKTVLYSVALQYLLINKMHLKTFSHKKLPVLEFTSFPTHCTCFLT
jgi:hypothetical protein